MPHEVKLSAPPVATRSAREKPSTTDPPQRSPSLPYWLVNVPRAKWPTECPSFLRNQSEKNIGILATPDEAYVPQGWEVVKEIVATNRIDRFQRLPSSLRKYLEYKERIVAEYGSIMRFIIRERLRWGDGKAEDLKARGRPFEFDEDMRILYNDWPYGVEEGIVHLVVWTKFALEDDPATGDLTPRARQEIDDYVTKVFRSRMPADEVIWFRNWQSLKSVHAVEHFHVMLHHPDEAFLKEITQGDVPLHARVEE
ncbi:hypothetical protein ATEIFO6365_0013001900 [Aspergillus terreus]|uniref:Uncharacterized protein n=1 Tax=Aspergillus terreus TaxID=33178 RepID=A0A5M3ZFM9_ASPTE|nr:hypothetical protein ATETN484_0014001900 [Aspergillus terreus]GFF20685.1 hypothetical protein ATEIFO6365_0013001900 [Aspergillus terreus]